MTEPDLGPDLEQFGINRRRRILGTEPELFRGPPDEQWFSRGVGRRELQQPPRAGRKGTDPPLEAILDAPGKSRHSGDGVTAREIGRVDAARQFLKCEWVAASLRKDSIANALVDPAWDRHLEQRSCVRVVQPAQVQLGQAGQPVPTGLPDSAHDSHRIGQEPARDELEHRRGGIVEPLEVIDDAQQRALLGHRGQETERRQRDQEPVGRVA